DGLAHLGRPVDAPLAQGATDPSTPGFGSNPQHADARHLRGQLLVVVADRLVELERHAAQHPAVLRRHVDLGPVRPARNVGQLPEVLLPAVVVRRGEFGVGARGYGTGLLVLLGAGRSDLHGWPAYRSPTVRCLDGLASSSACPSTACRTSSRRPSGSWTRRSPRR